MNINTYFHPHPPKYVSLDQDQPHVPLERVALQPYLLTSLKDLQKETHTTPPPKNPPHSALHSPCQLTLNHPIVFHRIHPPTALYINTAT